MKHITRTSTIQRMSKFAKKSWKMARKTGGSVSTEEKSVIDDTETVEEVTQDEIVQEDQEPCLEFARRGVCWNGENCKLNHKRKLCRSFLIRGECWFTAEGRRCKFKHYQKICLEFQMKGKCTFEQKTGRECRRNHTKGDLYKKGIAFA